MCWHSHGHARDARNIDPLRNPPAFSLVARLRIGAFPSATNVTIDSVCKKKKFTIVFFSDGYRIKITEIVYQDYLNLSPQFSYIPQISPSCLSVFNNSTTYCVQLYTIIFLCVQLFKVTLCSFRSVEVYLSEIPDNLVSVSVGLSVCICLLFILLPF